MAKNALKSCGLRTAKCLRYFWPFFNITTLCLKWLKKKNQEIQYRIINIKTNKFTIKDFHDVCY